MKISHHHLMWATALATSLAFAPLAVEQIRAQGSVTVPTDPGFKPDTGQINPGVEHPAPSSSTDIQKIPTHAEAIAALMAPDDPVSALGQQPGQESGQESVQSPSGATAPETTGIRPASSASQNHPGPIGATGQTMPAKFSKRNDTLDRLPIMAWPMRLTDQERQRIYQAVMADRSQPAADADALTPASELSTEQALNQTHALPGSLQDIDQLKRLTYVKAKNKVLLIEPSTRIVVDEVSS